MGHFELSCPGCSSKLRLDDVHRGRILRCPSCRVAFRLPLDGNTADSGPRSARTESAKTDSDAPRTSPIRKARLSSAPPQDRSASVRPVARVRKTSSPEESNPSVLPGRSIAAGSKSQTRKGRGRPGSRSAQSNTFQQDFSDDEREDLNDPWDTYDDYTSDDYTSLPSRPAAHHRKTSTSARKALKITLIVLLSLCGVGVLGAVALTLVSLIPGNVVDMTYLPENTAGVLHLRVSRLMNSEMVKSLIAKTPELQQALTADTGQLHLTPSDIETVTVGISESAGIPTGFPSMGPGMAWSRPGRGDAVLTVIRLAKAFKPTDLHLVETGKHGSAVLYRGGNDVVWMPTSQIVVLGRRSEIEKAIDRGTKQIRFRKLDFADTGGDIMFAVAVRPSPDSATLSPDRLPPGFASLARLGNNIAGTVTGVGFSVIVTDRLNIKARFACGSESETASLQSDFETALADIKSEITKIPGLDQMEKLRTGLLSILNGLSATSQFRSVDLDVTIEQSVIDALSSAAPR